MGVLVRTGRFAPVAACLLVAACGSSAGSSGPQTTTIVTPPPTVDRAALAATWNLSGNWLIYPPARTGDITNSEGFAVFDVQPNGDRIVSAGHGECFVFSGRAVEDGDRMQTVPLEGYESALVECDPGPAPETFARAVECLSAGCYLELRDDVLRLTAASGQPLADLVRTANSVP